MAGTIIRKTGIALVTVLKVLLQIILFLFKFKHDSNESDTGTVYTCAEDISGHDGSIHKGVGKHQGTKEDNRLLQVCYFCAL